MILSSDPLHDEINLIRLLRRLEPPKEESSPQSWTQAQGTLQKVKFARRLLKNVEYSDGDLTSQRVQQFDEMRAQLDRIESSLKEIERPAPPRPTPILPSIPRPSPPRSWTLDLPASSSSAAVEGQPPAVHTDDLLLPADTPSSSTSFVFPTPMPLLTPSTSTAASTSVNINTSVSSRRAATSAALHEELSSQMNQMASQLKRNALHFSDSLARDAAVVEETQTKLENNFDVMQKERVRLRDHRGKSGSTTCLVVLIVLAVLVLFVLMVGLIRFSRI